MPPIGRLQLYGFADFHFSCFSDNLPTVRRDVLQEESFPIAAGLSPFADQPGGDDPGVIEDETVLRLQEFGQVPDVPMLKRLCFPVNDQQPGVGTIRQRLLSNESAGKRGIVLTER